MRKGPRKIVRIVPILAAIILSLAVDLPGLRPSVTGQKPMFPVLARLELTGAPARGGNVTLLASVTAWTPGEELLWSLDLPPGVQVTSGPIQWTGSLARGETRSFEISIRVPDDGLHEVTATLRAAERPSIRSAATVPIDLGGFEGPRASEQIVSGDGETYIQYQGTVLPR
jgi:hypothetical protein